MKFKFVLSLFALGSAFSIFAQGYKDGVEYYKADQFENAKIILERNFDKPETDKALASYYLGRIALLNGDNAKAKQYFEKGIAANPESPYNYIGQGALSLKEGNAKAAEDFFKIATSKDKKNPKVNVAIARAYALANPTVYAKEIEKNIERAKKTDKKDPDAYMFEGDMFAAKKEWGPAAGLYEMAMTFDSNLSEAYVKYANTYFFINPKLAIEKLNELLVANPNSALAQRELAEKYYEDNQWTKAAEVYGEYIKNPNHFKVDEERYAVLLYFGEKNQQSLELAQRILAENPNAFLMKRIIFLNKAALKDYAGAEEMAKDFFASGSEKNKFSSNDYTTYGVVLKELGRQEESLLQFEKAFETNPEKTELLKDLSAAYGSAENYEKSAYYYQKFVDTASPSTNDYYVLAGKYQNMISTAKNDTAKFAARDNAIKYIDIVLERVPDDYRIIQRKARIQLVSEASRKEGLALGSYNKMLELLNADPESKTKNAEAYKEAYNYIAAYYFENGNKAEAKNYYIKYLEFDPNNEALKEYIDKLK